MPPKKKKAGKKKAEIEVIDLFSSSPPVAPAPAPSTFRASNLIPQKRAFLNDPDPDSEDTEDSEVYDPTPPPEPLEIPMPNLEDLAKQYPARDDLYKHLVSLPVPVLSNILIVQLLESKGKSKAKLKLVANTLAHCVYCHQVYDTRNNSGCKIKHWGDFEDEGFTCCGLYVYWESDNPARPPPEEVEPYCYEGPYHDREMDKEDQEDDP